jgi:hypothetical protein
MGAPDHLLKLRQGAMAGASAGLSFGQDFRAIAARQYTRPNAQHHWTTRIVQSVPSVESASSIKLVVAR